MIDSSAHTRFESAIAAQNPVPALLDLARALKAEGVSQDEMVRFYASKHGEHYDDVEDTIRDAIADAADCICGHAFPRIFDTIV
jgi:hypothetical protein